MIAYLKGKVLYSDENSVVLETNGIGYELICSAQSRMRLITEGGGEVYTYMSVREDGVSLFGFDTVAEKNMFLKLISVSGIGPKMGIGILSGISLDDLALAIAASDVKTLSKIKGLGKKTAERLILELREAISVSDAGSISPVARAEKLSGEEEDAVIALMSLGYNRAQALSSVKAAIESGAKGLENVIREALKRNA